MKNSVCGKAMENVRKWSNITIVNSTVIAIKHTTKPSFEIYILK